MRLSCISSIFLIVSAPLLAFHQNFDGRLQSEGAQQTNASLPEFNRGTDKLDERLHRDMATAKATGITTPGIAILIHDEISGEPGFPNLNDLFSFFRPMVCRSNAIVIGSVISSQAHLSDDHSTVFTDYGLILSEVVLNRTDNDLTAGETLTLARFGGTMQLPDGSLSLEDEAVPLLIQSSPYLFFLRHIPETGAYEALNPNGTFSIRGDRLTLFRKGLQVPALRQMTLRGLSSLLQGLSADCQSNTGR